MGLLPMALLLTLLVSPLREGFRSPLLLRARRILGVAAFAYALLHFTIYAALELGLDFGDLGRELARRPYITLGFAALLALAPLAATSTDRMVRRLGRRWAVLHKLVYPAAILAAFDVVPMPNRPTPGTRATRGIGSSSFFAVTCLPL